MSLTRPDLQIAVTQSEACDTMTLADTTGEYPAASAGYGAPSTIIHDDVTSLVIVVRNKSTGTYFTYTFTILLQVVQATTLSIDGGTATTITSEVGAIAFPFITDVNEFDLWGDYGVDLPEFEDAVWQIEYTISGTSSRGGVSNEAFSYTTSVCEMVTCDICCCISKMWAALDPGCECNDSAQLNAQNADTNLQIALAAADMGDVTKAVAALAKAQDLCDCGCSDC